MDKHPYSPDEQRVAKFFFDLGIGGGDDPIGALIISHMALVAERNEYKQAAGVEANLRREFDAKATAMQEERDELQQTFDLRWKADMRAIKRWQAAHPGNDLTWPDHADLVVWLLRELDKSKT